MLQVFDMFAYVKLEERPARCAPGTPQHRMGGNATLRASALAALS